MEVISTVLQTISIVTAIIGIVITVIGLPGVWLVYLSMLLWGWNTGFVQLTPTWLVFFLFVSILSNLIDNVAILLGANKYGATKWGVLGTVVGLIVGAIIGNIPGLVLGAFLGAVLGEMLLSKQDGNLAIKAGIGTVIGFFIGNFVKMLIAISMCLAWWIIVR